MRSAAGILRSADDDLMSMSDVRWCPTERRSAARTLTVYRVALASTGTDSGFCRVHNISDYGLMADAELDASKGQGITISFSDTITVSGTVVWVDQTKIGVRFTSAIDSAALLQTLASKRGTMPLRAPRLRTDTIAVTSSEIGTCIARVLDVSQRGMRISHDGRLEPGLQLQIALESGLQCRGVVRWSKDLIAGIMLLEPIAYKQLGRASAL